MRTIRKFDLEIDDSPQVKEMPRDAEILFIHPQDGLLMMWTLVVPERARVRRQFAVHETRHPIPQDREYVGSAVMPPFVWHVFEIKD